MIELKPKQVALINLALTGTNFGVAREHNLQLIEKQISQLPKDDDCIRVAHGVYMLDTLRPFTSENRRTACAWAKSVMPENPFDLTQLAGMLKHNVKARQIAEFLRV